jgi:predicted phosphodiesterase
MRIAVISDLHMGRGDASDRFGHDDARFVRFLRYLESDFERIVLLGDVYETLMAPRPWDLRGELRTIREAHPRLAERFADRRRYVYVHGNHDIVAGRLERVPAEWLVRADGVSILFTHGHGYDLILRRMRWVSELAVWLGGWIMRLGLRGLYRVLDEFEARCRCPDAPDVLGGFHRWALDLAARRRADIVVTGHTHRPDRRRHGNALYLNAGTCSDGRFSFLGLDTRAGRHELHAW